MRDRALEIVSQIKAIHDNEPLRLFIPNAAQQRYIDAVGNPLGYIVIFAAANGIGKTAATAAMLAAIIWPEMAPRQYFNSWIYEAWPYPKDIRIVSTPQQLNEGGSIQRELKRWFPKDKYTAVKNSKNYFSQYLAKDFTINLMSYDMAVEAFEGATLGLAVFDEPPPKPIFNASTARMRKGGRILFPGTPLIDAAWIMDDLVSKTDGEYIQTVSGDIEANCWEHGKNGLLKHSDIERMLAAYDADELEARRDGKFMHLSGRIFKGFDRNVHVAKEEFYPPDEGVSIGMVCDPAIAKPLALIWRYVDAQGVLNYYDESPDVTFEGAKDSNLTVSDYAALIKSKEAGRTVDSRIIDRHFAAVRRTLGGKTLTEEFAEHGIDFTPSYQTDEEIETGIAKLKEYLKYDKTKPIDSLNQPRIRISPKCKNLISALERWARDPKSGKPQEEYKDFVDCLRYDVMSNPEIEVAREWPDVKTPYYGVNV